MKNSKINIYLTIYVLFTLVFYCLNNSNNISIHKKSYNINYKMEEKTFYVKEEITYSLKNLINNNIKSENDNYLMRIKQYFSNQYSNLLIQGNNISKVKIENEKEYIIANVQFNFSFNKENLENGIYLYKLKYSYNIHRDINFLLRDNNLIYEDFDFFLLNKINENSYNETRYKTDIELKFQFNENSLSIEEKDNSLFYTKNKKLLKNSYDLSNSSKVNTYDLNADNDSRTQNLNALKPDNSISGISYTQDENSDLNFEDIENPNYLQNTEMSMKDFIGLNNSITLYFKDLLGDLVIFSAQQGKIEKNHNNNQYIAIYKFNDLVFGSASYEKIYFTQIFNSLAHKELEKFILSNNIVFYVFSIIFFIITTVVLIKILLSFRAKESTNANIDTSLSKPNKKFRNPKLSVDKKNYDLDFSSDSSDEEIENEESKGKRNIQNKFNQFNYNSNSNNNNSIVDTLSFDEDFKIEDIVVYN